MIAARSLAIFGFIRNTDFEARQSANTRPLSIEGK
jgi:hypothetical protein